MEVTKSMIDRKILNVRHLLIDAKMTQQELVDALGIKRTRLANAINGYFVQPWAYDLLEQAENYLYKRLSE